MNSSNLDLAIQAYELAFSQLNSSDITFDEQQVLELLMARDHVQRAIEAEQTISLNTLTSLRSLDIDLVRRSADLAEVCDLSTWRRSLRPPDDAWWWHFEKRPEDDRAWIWRILSTVVLTLALSVLIDTSTRFLRVGSDTFAIFAVLAQSILAMLAAGGALTNLGRHLLERVQVKRKFPSFFGFILATLLLSIFLVFGLSLPTIAIVYNNRGLDHYNAGRLTSAEYDYLRALSLNSDYVEAHYNLGLLYEDLQDYSRARDQYEEARQGDLDAAYNNLARLKIRDAEFSAAVALLLDGLSLTEDETVRYDMLKNLGWARLQQGRLTEARVHLEEAVELEPRNAAAHCLLAQVYDALVDLEMGHAEWERCLQYASSNNPDEDAWIGLARRALQPEGS